MAATNIVLTALSFNAFAELPATAAVDSTDKQALVPYNKEDRKILLVVENSSELTDYDVTIKAGNGLQGVLDLVFEVPAGETHCIVIESMKFVNMSGENKGKVLIEGENAAIKVAAVALP